ncbi:hypothetical protein EU245_05180 [Lentibacillus lipolyticus]|nr:hypothetical protein EU245_05180 [Lentibacillus lipolyticus]
MKKAVFAGISVMMLVVPLAMQINWGSKTFADTLQIDPADITKLQLSIPGTSSYNSTSNRERINTFLRYMNKQDYTLIKGNKPSYLPMTASMIYVSGNDKTDFIVSFGNKILVSHTYYEVTEGAIDNEFLRTFYHSLD